MEPIEAAAFAAPAYMEDWASRVFARLGVPEANAREVARSLLNTSLRGVDSHGLMRVPIYAERLRRGGINPRPDVRVLRETSGTALLDGDNGMGQVVASRAMEIAIAKASACGSSFVLARRTNHFGAAAEWAAAPAGHGMIGWATTNTPPIVAPWGSREAVVGNNPIAVAVPTGEDQPMILDMALSTVAGGKLRYAAKNGVETPPDWALAPDGSRTTDPNLGLLGALLPTGGYKGSGLAIMTEVLTGLLAGSGASEDVQLVWERTDTPGNVASAFGAIDIGAFIDLEPFQRSVRERSDRIRSAPPVPGGEPVQVPGDPELQATRIRTAQGVPLPAAIIAEMSKLGEDVGVPFDVTEGDGMPDRRADRTSGSSAGREEIS